MKGVNMKKYHKELTSGDDLSEDKKLEICQYYLDNYPVKIPISGWTKLDIKINGGSESAINRAFSSLKEAYVRVEGLSKESSK